MPGIRPSKRWFAAMAAAVSLGAGLLTFGATAPVSADGVTSVTPNGGQYAAGVNAVVIVADRSVTPTEVVTALERAAPGRRVADLWILARGQWLNYHPSAPGASSLGNLGTATAVYVTLR